MAIKLTQNKTNKNANKTQDVLNRLKKLKDAELVIDLKELDWKDTQNPQTKHYSTRFEIGDVRVRIQIFIK